MTPSPAARKAAERIAQIWRDGNFSKASVGELATIIEQETHCGEMVKALDMIFEDYGNTTQNEVRRAHVMKKAGEIYRAVLDKVK